MPSRPSWSHGRHLCQTGGDPSRPHAASTVRRTTITHQPTREQAVEQEAPAVRRGEVSIAVKQHEFVCLGPQHCDGANPEKVVAIDGAVLPVHRLDMVGGILECSQGVADDRPAVFAGKVCERVATRLLQMALGSLRLRVCCRLHCATSLDVQRSVGPPRVSTAFAAIASTLPAGVAITATRPRESPARNAIRRGSLTPPLTKRVFKYRNMLCIARIKSLSFSLSIPVLRIEHTFRPPEDGMSCFGGFGREFVEAGATIARIHKANSNFVCSGFFCATATTPWAIWWSAAPPIPRSRSHGMPASPGSGVCGSNHAGTAGLYAAMPVAVLLSCEVSSSDGGGGTKQFLILGTDAKH